MTHLRLILLNAALATMCLAFAITSYAPTGPAIAFGVAAWVTLKLSVSGLFSLSGTAIALAQISWSMPQLEELGIMVLLGIGLGALTYLIKQGASHLRHEGAIGTGIWLALAAIAVAVLPDSTLLLQNTEGTPLLLGALVQEAATGTRLEISVPALIHHPGPLHWVTSGLPVLSGIAIAALVFKHLTRHEQSSQALFMPLGLIGGLLMLVGIAGYIQLVTGAVELPDAQSWRAQLNAATGGTLIVDRLDLPKEGILGTGSRVAIDIFRLIMGAIIVVFTVGVFRSSASEERPKEGSMTPVLIAIGAIAVPVFCFADGPQMLGMSSALACAAAAAIVGCLSTTPRRLPYDLAMASMLIISFTLVAPLAGWMHA